MARPNRKPQVPDQRTQALRALRALVAMLGGSARAIESQSGLTNAQLYLLRQIAAHDAPSINDLAALVNTRQNTVSSVVGRLVDQGMIRKQQSATDKRRVALVLAPKGRRALAKAPESSTELLLAAIAALRPARLHGLTDGLNALVAELGVDPEHAPLLFEAEG